MNKRIQDELVWMGYKHRVSPGEGFDVSVRISGNSKGENYKAVCFTFRNKSAERLGNKRIEVAVFNRFLFFRASDKGVKICDSGSNKRAQITVCGDEIAKFKRFEGNYSLKYDTESELFYIEKESN